jgi:hypothetical protein
VMMTPARILIMHLQLVYYIMDDLLLIIRAVIKNYHRSIVTTSRTASARKVVFSCIIHELQNAVQS